MRGFGLKQALPLPHNNPMYGKVIPEMTANIPDLLRCRRPATDRALSSRYAGAISGSQFIDVERNRCGKTCETSVGRVLADGGGKDS